MTLKQQKIVASLDIGSNKIVCLIGYINGMGKICIKGIGHQQSRGIQCGKIINKKEAEKSILTTISLAEKMAGYNINSITIGISTSEIFSSTINSNIDLNGKEVKDKDVLNLLKNIKNILRNEEKEIIHLMPLQYCLDNNVVDSPYNIEAENLEITFHLLSTKKQVLNKIKDCIKATVLDINNYVSCGYASSLSVLNETERELGALILDIGASGTNLSVVYNNKYVYEGNIKIGGDIITKDMSIILKTTQEIAEKVKVLNANFTLSEKDEENLIKLEINGDEEFEVAKSNIKLVNDISKARIEEIIKLAMKQLEENGLQNIPQYIILVGGTSLIPGIDSFINHLTGLETRIGYNEGFNIQDKNLMVELKNPIYSVSTGILKFIQSKNNSKNMNVENNMTFVNILKKIFC